MAEWYADLAAESAPVQHSPPTSPPPAPAIRFSLGGMLVVTSAAAVIVASLFAFPPIVSAAVATLMSTCIPAALIGCLIYGNRSWRAFAIGMLVPSVMRIVSSFIGGLGAVSGSGATVRMIASQQLRLQSVFVPQGVGGPVRAQQGGAFDYFAQLAETWDKLGYAYMTDETLFWVGSTIAGLTTLFVHKRFTSKNAGRTS